MGAFDSLARGFLLGQQMAEGFEKARDRKALRDIGKATPEQSEGFTAEQGDQLRAAAESGQYDIGYDDTKKAYTVTPKAGGETGMIAQQGVTDFLGERAAGTMSQDVMDKARTNAMAKVIERNNPVEAMRMRREATQLERDNMRFGWEKSRSERDERNATEKEAEDRLLKDIDAETATFIGGLQAGPDGQSKGQGINGSLAGLQFRANRLMESGKIDKAQDATEKYRALAFAKIQLETAERDKALAETISAVNAGNINAIGTFYDTYLPDGGKTKAITRQKDGSIVVERQTPDGRSLQPMVAKDTNHLTAQLATLKNPMAVYDWTQSEFRNTLAINADRRAGNADARAASEHAASMADRQRKRDEEVQKASAGVAYFSEKNPDASPAAIEAVRRGVISVEPKSGYKVEAGDVTSLLGTPATDAQGKPIMDPMTGRQVVNRDPAKEAAFFAFMRDNRITDTNEALAKYLAPRAGGVGASAGSQSATTQPPKVNSQAELAKLPKGSKYTAPDGSVRIKQ